MQLHFGNILHEFYFKYLHIQDNACENIALFRHWSFIKSLTANVKPEINSRKKVAGASALMPNLNLNS